MIVIIYISRRIEFTFGSLILVLMRGDFFFIPNYFSFTLSPGSSQYKNFLPDSYYNFIMWLPSIYEQFEILCKFYYSNIVSQFGIKTIGMKVTPKNHTHPLISEKLFFFAACTQFQLVLLVWIIFAFCILSLKISTH